MERDTPTRLSESIPVDPDVDQRSNGPARPVHMRMAYIGLVLAGGTLGTLARYLLESTLPAPGGWPLPTFLVNICGAFLLGVVLEAVLRRGPDAGRLRLIRLGAGTGFMGAFTTYSTFALESVQLQHTANYLGAITYVLLSLFVGVAASAAGIWAASSHHARRSTRHEDKAQGK